MYIDLHNKKRIRTNSKWLIFIIFIVIIFATEPFYREPLLNKSLTFIRFLQGSEPEKNNFIRFVKFISYLGTNLTYFIIIIFVYNYVNIFKTFTLLMCLIISIAEFSILKMIYEGPRPYFLDREIVPIGCDAGWGNPSGHSITSVAFYLTLWHILTDNKFMRNRSILKNLFLFLTILLIFTIMFSRIILGAHSFNQIIFGGLLGFGIYFFLFYVLCLRVNDSKQFDKILNFTNIMHGTINFLIFLFAILVYNFNAIGEQILNNYENIIDEKCVQVPKNKRFQNEGIINFAICLANIGAFIGIKFEYFFSFNDNKDKWNQFNFEMNEFNDDSSLMTKITINRETQWNHTNSIYSILRLLLIVVLSAVLMFPYFFVDWDNNIIVVFIFKLVVPTNTITFSFFFLFKVIMKSLRIVNMSLYSLNDSL